jgi:flagellar biosynthesis/type III secretory pathway protein FliH
VVNKDIEKDEFKEILLEVKGEDKMSTLAQRWLDEGIQLGIAQGMQQGMQRGVQQGIFETAIVMIKDFQLAIDDVVQKLNIKKEELLAYMEDKKA